MYFYATNPPIHSSMCHHCCRCRIVALWLLSLWFCRSRHIVVVSLSLSCIVAVSSPSLRHCIVFVVFVVFIVIMLWVSSSSCCGCHRCCCHVMSWLWSSWCHCCSHRHFITVVVITVLLSLSHCHCVVAVALLLCCCCHCHTMVLLCCCGVVMSVYGPECRTCHTWPTLGFSLAHPVHPGYPPCGWPRTSYLPSSLCHHCCIVAVSCHCHIVTASCHIVTVSLSSSHCCCVIVVITLLLCRVALSLCLCHVIIVIALLLCHRIVAMSSLSLLSHCCCVVIVIIVTSSPNCVVSSSHCCHIVSLSLSLHHCHCCVVVVIASLQLLHGEHGAAGLRAGTGRSYSVAWDAAVIVGERR